MTSNAPISVSTPADILSYVPHVLGFQPRESLVFITMAGKRVGATLRLDLPKDSTDPLDYAQGVREYLEADSAADGVLMVLYTEQEWAEPEAPPFAALVHCLDLVLDAAGLTLLDGWLISSSSWRDYFCDDAACCPWPGHPLAAITESVLNTELVFQGSSYADSLEAAVGLLGSERQEDVHRLTCQYLAQWVGNWERTSVGHDSLVLWDSLIARVLDGGALEAEPEVIAFLLAGLTRGSVRDGVIVLAGAGLDAASDAADQAGILPAGMPRIALPAECARLIAEHLATRSPAEPLASEPGGSLFSEVFLATSEFPDWQRLDAAYSIFLGFSAIAEGESRAALLSILGWLEWARGRGSRAHRFLQEALDETPAYTLAELLLQLVGSGSLAPWARSRDTSWTSEPRRVA
ncbi:hypothetical protein BJ994_001197 [Arthrobacter pigmenti]|uniref:DUF4192 domain-containing protein n=1 Tax=Arthrobacter pigmenti TaxID=271432 RepID=A0A846RV23_9MICC|nr:DUF4192 domain-containing protein [Arthrobacter pigmenti]NJC22121.1 hypothetical protein [Arthrobacter pigmenti]